MDVPPWLDPDRDLVLTPRALRGVLHPIRLRLLELLQREGPATATGLAAEIGQSSGVTSYHLRVLAEHGMIAEDTERGTRRDRWWRAVHRSTSFTFRMPGDDGDPDAVEAAEGFLRYNADEAHRRTTEFIATISAQAEPLADVPWALDDWPLRLTREQARQFVADVRALAGHYHRQPGDPDPQPGTERAIFQFQLLPDER
ncbi:MAG TPA: helix-turn-helix domain-containing protein [Jatrophihabitans sp.]